MGLNVFLFTDDVAVVANRVEGVQHTLQVTEEHKERAGIFGVH